MVQSLHNRRQKGGWIIGLMLHLDARRWITTAALITQEEANAKANNTCCEDARTLCKQGRLEEALHILQLMEQQGIPVDSSTHASFLHGCVSKNALSYGKLVHAHIIQTGLKCQDIFLGNTLVNMYAKCGIMVDARRILDQLPKRNVVSWTIMIAAYARHGQAEEALNLICQMQRACLQPNQFTFASILPVCAHLATLQHGKEIHEQIIRSGFQCDVTVGNALLDMYSKCRSTENARHVFDQMPQRNVVSWNSMISGYAQNANVDEALKLFWKMSERDVVSWTIMIAGYSQNGRVEEALKLFERMPERDLVSWNAMIAGYAQNGRFDETLKLFRQMQLAGMKPNSETFTSVLPGCANLASLEQGMEVHDNIIRSGFLSDVLVGSALIDMYAKCGKIKDACKVFDKMRRRDIVSWNAMIKGYAMHGCGKEALQIFEQMQHLGMNPDHVTFVGILHACCHAGLVDDAWQLFDCMSQCYNITPALEHYCCMVDLLGRAGQFHEAQDFINKMPIKPDAAVWGSLLGSCRIHNNMELGEFVAERLFELEPTNAAPYVLLSNIYAAAGRWDGIEKVRKMMKDRSVRKPPGCSWIQLNNQVYIFLGGEIAPTNTQDLCKVGEIFLVDGGKVCA
eukprot:Gb_29020 [translate_table: standard]